MAVTRAAIGHPSVIEDRRLWAAFKAAVVVVMCHVLIIEDEWLIAEYLTHLAEQAGATSIAMACTEDEAVNSAHERIPGIILSDVSLLVGTGPHAVQTITASLGSIPVIFITATPEACLPCEAPSVILRKPVNPAAVIEFFRRLAPV